MVPSGPTYPVLMAAAPTPKFQHVRALYPYTAIHKDELSLEQGLNHWNDESFDLFIFLKVILFYYWNVETIIGVKEI